MVEMFQNEIIKHNVWTKIRKNKNFPSLKCIYQPTGMCCEYILIYLIQSIDQFNLISDDISFTNGLAVCNAHMMRHLFTVQPEGCNLLIFIRMFLLDNDLMLKGATLAQFVAFFLQQEKLLKPIQSIQDGELQIMINRYNNQCLIKESSPSFQVNKIQSYKDLILPFFTYYANFKFELKKISTFFGRAILKGEIIDPMVIEAPMSRDSNLCRYVTKEQVLKFKWICEKGISSFSRKQKEFSKEVLLDHLIPNAVQQEGIKLFFSIRHFLSKNNLKLKKGTLTKLVIFFLQQFLTNKSIKKKESTVATYSQVVKTRPYENSQADGNDSLITFFFNFYLKFDFEFEEISILHGKPDSKRLETIIDILKVHMAFETMMKPDSLKSLNMTNDEVLQFKNLCKIFLLKK